MIRFLSILLLSVVSLVAQGNRTVMVSTNTGVLNAGTFATGVFPNITQFATDEQDISSQDPRLGRFLISLTQPVSGFWVWDNASTDPSGDGVIEAAGYVTGRWVRQFGGTTAPDLDSSKGVVIDSSKRIVASTATKQQIDKAAMQVATVADMVSLSTNLNNGQLIQTGGFWSNGDGGGATYRWDSSASSATNLGNFAGPSGTGRFTFLAKDKINVRAFGAKGDDSTDDYAAIQGAINFAVANYIADVYFPEGVFQTSQTIEHYAPCNLIGVGTVYSAADSSVRTNSAYAATGKSRIKLAANSNVPLINVNTTNRHPQVTGSTTDDGVTNITKRVHGGILKGLVLDGNGSNQTKRDCDLVRILYIWQYTIENCAFVRPSGYMVWTRECNVVNIKGCNGVGDLWDRSKGILWWSMADSKFVGNDIGGTAGPILQISGVGGWQNIVEGNLLFNSITYRRTVTGVSSDTVTFSSTHNYETGSPIEFVPASGGTIPTQLEIGRPYWAIKVSSTQVKVAATYEGALAGTAIAITAGTGTYYGWHGYSSGVDLTWNASKNTIVGNRCDQHEQHGISLYDASQNPIVGNLANFNQYNTQTDSAASESAAGIALLGECTGNVIGFNDVSYRLSKYPQDYGVLETGTNYSNVISQNSSQGNSIAKYSFASAGTRLLDWSDATSAAITKTGPFNNSGNYSIAIGSSSITTVSSTGLAVTGGITASTSIAATGALSGATASVGSTGAGTVFDVTGGTGGVALSRWIRSGQNTFGILLSNGWIVSDETNVKRLFTAAWDGSAPRITFGSASASAPVGTTIQGEVANGSNIAGSFLNLRSGTGTGNASVSSATISFQTPDAGSSGSTPQTHVTRASVGDFGVNIGPAGSGTPIRRITFGVATLSAGTVTPTATTVTANTRIFLTSQADGGTPGWLRVTARSVGANFTITSSSATDTSTVAFLLVEP